MTSPRRPSTRQSRCCIRRTIAAHRQRTYGRPASDRPCSLDHARDDVVRACAASAAGRSAQGCVTAAGHHVPRERRVVDVRDTARPSRAASMSAGDPNGSGLDRPTRSPGPAVLVSLGLFVYTRRTDRDPRTILDLGLAYMVFTALALGLTFHWALMPEHSSTAPVISWIGAVVLMFAAIVPSTPGQDPARRVRRRLHEPDRDADWPGPAGLWDFESATNALLMHYPDYLLVGVAVVISHVVTGLGQQVAKAREMGSYQLGELLGRGGMGEVYNATHRMLARPAAIKLIRPEMIGASAVRTARAGGLRVSAARPKPRPACDRRTPWSCTTSASPRTGRCISSWSCWRGWTSSRWCAQTWPDAREPRGPHPAPGVRVTRGGARARAGAPGHQAREHPRRTARARVRLRQGARLRPGEADAPTPAWSIRCATQAGSVLGTPGYMAPEMALSRAGRRASGSVFARVRRLLPLDRPTGIRRRPRSCRCSRSISRRGRRRRHRSDR